MALPTPRTVSVPFVGGIDDKLDARVLPNTNLQQAYNVVYAKAGLVEKREGFYTTQSNSGYQYYKAFSSRNELVGVGIGTYLAPGPVVVETLPTAYGYVPGTSVVASEDQGSWISRGTVPEFVGWRRHIQTGDGPLPVDTSVTSAAGLAQNTFVTGGVYFFNTSRSNTQNVLVHVWATTSTHRTSLLTNSPTRILMRIETLEGEVLCEKLATTLLSGDILTRMVATTIGDCVVILIAQNTNIITWITYNIADPLAPVVNTGTLPSAGVVQLNSSLEVAPIYSTVGGETTANGVAIAFISAGFTAHPNLVWAKYDITLSVLQYSLSFNIRTLITLFDGLVTHAVNNIGMYMVTSGGAETETSWLIFSDTDPAVVAQDFKLVGLRVDTWAVTIPVFTAVSGFYGPCGIIRTSTTTATGIVARNSNDQDPGLAKITRFDVTTGAVVSNTKTLLHEYNLFSKPFSTSFMYEPTPENPHRIYAVLYNVGYNPYGNYRSLQGGYHVVDLADFREVCRLAPRQSLDPLNERIHFFNQFPGLSRGSEHLVNISRLSDTLVVFPGLVDVTQYVGALTLFGLDAGEPESSNTFGLGCGQSKWDTLSLGETTLIAGGRVSAYDGFLVTELGYASYPVISPSTTATYYSPGPGTWALFPVGDEVYNYAILYAYEDARGILHRSAPSTFSSDNTFSTPNGTVLMLLPSLSLTDRQIGIGTDITRVFIEVYRTTAVGSTYHFVTRVPNTLNGGMVQALDDVSDAFLTSQATLYTDGGVQPAYAPPSATSMTLHQNCVWLAGCDNMRQIWISKPLEVGVAPEFNDDRVIQMPEDILCIRPMDGLMYAFGRNRVYSIRGTPPDARGQGGSIQDPEPLPSAKGCDNPRGIIVTDDGIWYSIDNGLGLVSRNGAVLEVLEVQTRLIGVTITSSCVDATRNLILFSCIKDADNTEGFILVYNENTKAWTIWSALCGTDPEGSGTAVHSLVSYRGQTTFARASNRLYLYGNPTSQSDAGQWFSYQIKMPEVHLAELSGFQRVWKAKLLGRGIDPCFVQLAEMTDFDTTGQTLTKDYSASIGPTVEPEIYFKNQRCSNATITVKDLQPTGWDGLSGGGSVSWNSVTFQVGVLPGVRRTVPNDRAV